MATWFEANPLPVTQENLLRGREIYKEHCIGCHGVNGDGAGRGAAISKSAARRFHLKRTRSLWLGQIAGRYYWRILRGIPGTAMENFGTRARFDDIWRVMMFLKTIPNGGLQHIPTPECISNGRAIRDCFLGKLFLSRASGAGNAALRYEDNTPPGVGDVAAMVAPGEVNPAYAANLYVLENQKIPCSPDEPNASRARYCERRGKPPDRRLCADGGGGLHFIPEGVNPEDYGQGWLDDVWSRPMPTQ